MLLHERGQAAKEPRAVGRSDGAPGRKGCSRMGYGLIGFFDARLLELGDRLLGGGIENRERHRPLSPRS
jgi:hypothetical protein